MGRCARNGPLDPLVGAVVDEAGAGDVAGHGVGRLGRPRRLQQQDERGHHNVATTPMMTSVAGFGRRTVDEPDPTAAPSGAPGPGLVGRPWATGAIPGCRRWAGGPTRPGVVAPVGGPPVAPAVVGRGGVWVGGRLLVDGLAAPGGGWRGGGGSGAASGMIHPPSVPGSGLAGSARCRGPLDSPGLRDLVPGPIGRGIRPGAPRRGGVRPPRRAAGRPTRRRGPPRPVRGAGATTGRPRCRRSCPTPGSSSPGSRSASGSGSGADPTARASRRGRARRRPCPGRPRRRRRGRPRRRRSRSRKSRRELGVADVADLHGPQTYCLGAVSSAFRHRSWDRSGRRGGSVNPQEPHPGRVAAVRTPAAVGITRRRRGRLPAPPAPRRARPHPPRRTDTACVARKPSSN